MMNSYFSLIYFSCVSNSRSHVGGNPPSALVLGCLWGTKLPSTPKMCSPSPNWCCHCVLNTVFAVTESRTLGSGARPGDGGGDKLAGHSWSLPASSPRHRLLSRHLSRDRGVACGPVGPLSSPGLAVGPLGKKTQARLTDGSHKGVQSLLHWKGGPRRSWACWGTCPRICGKNLIRFGV